MRLNTAKTQSIVNFLLTFGYKKIFAAVLMVCYTQACCQKTFAGYEIRYSVFAVIVKYLPTHGIMIYICTSCAAEQLWLLLHT